MTRYLHPRSWWTGVIQLLQVFGARRCINVSFWHFVIFKTLIRTFLSSLSYFLSSAFAPLLTFFSPLSQLFIPSSCASFNFPSLSFLSRVVFSYSFPLPLLYLPSLSSCFICIPLFFSLCLLSACFWLSRFLLRFFFFFYARGENVSDTLNHPLPHSLPSCSLCFLVSIPH